jgi:hypothetical protein
VGETKKNLALVIAALILSALLVGLLAAIYNELNLDEDSIGPTVSDKSQLAVKPSVSDGMDSGSSVSPEASPSKVDNNISETDVQNCETNTGMNGDLCRSSLEALQRRYPELNLEQVVWSRLQKVFECDGNEIVEAKFSFNSDEIEAEFYPDGTLIEIEYERVGMSDSRLPEKVRQSLSRNYPNLSNTNFELEIHPNEEKFFEFEVDPTSDIDATYNINGEKVKNRCED